MALVDPTPSVRLRRPHVALALLLAMVLTALLPSVAEARSVARVRWVASASDGVPSAVAVRWQRVSAQISGLGQHRHVQFSTSTTPQAQDWQRAPVDACDFLVPHEPSQRLWIACELQGDGNDTPAVEQVRLEYDEPGWLPWLPAVYAQTTANGRFLASRVGATRAGNVTAVLRLQVPANVRTLRIAIRAVDRSENERVTFRVARLPR